MIPGKYIIPLLLALLSLTSCKITECTGTINIETMKPIASAFPESVKTVAIFNRDMNKTASHTLYNFDKVNLPCDTTLNDFELSNYCVDGLTSFLEQEAYFNEVNNYLDKDSISNGYEGPDVVYNSSDLFELTRADALIFLDFSNSKMKFLFFTMQPTVQGQPYHGQLFSAT